MFDFLNHEDLADVCDQVSTSGGHYLYMKIQLLKWICLCAKPSRAAPEPDSPLLQTATLLIFELRLGEEFCSGSSGPARFQSEAGSHTCDSKLLPLNHCSILQGKSSETFSRTRSAKVLHQICMVVLFRFNFGIIITKIHVGRHPR